VSDIDRTYQDDIGSDVRVVTVFDQQKQRWVTMVTGGALDGWSTGTDAEDADPAAQHARAIEAARGASDAV
jgi:hypothetical protein